MTIKLYFTTSVVFFLTLTFQGFSEAEVYCERYEKVCESPTSSDKSNIQNYACDTVTDGGRWFIIQRQKSLTMSFEKNWYEYKYGFGQLTKNYFMGNDNISCQTGTGKWELRVDMIYKGQNYFAKYSTFKVDSEDYLYRLTLDGFSGNVEDDLMYHNGRPFSTYDSDHDNSEDNCAKLSKSGWWFGDCRYVNLNGQFNNTDAGDGIIWKSITGFNSSLEFVEMKIRLRR